MNNNFLEILNTPIIHSSIDAFWEKQKAIDLTEKVAVVFTRPIASGSADELLITKMMAACGLKTDQYVMITMVENDRLAWHFVKEKTKAKKVLLFGINPEALGISALLVMNQINNFDAAQWLCTTTLSEVESTKGLKQHLWQNVFKPMFGI